MASALTRCRTGTRCMRGAKEVRCQPMAFPTISGSRCMPDGSADLCMLVDETPRRHWQHEEPNCLDDPIVEVAPSTTVGAGITWMSTPNAFVAIVVMVSVWVEAVRRCAELWHNIAYPSDEDAAVPCDEHCGAGGGFVQRSKAAPFDHVQMQSLDAAGCIFVLMLCRSGIAQALLWRWSSLICRCARSLACCHSLGVVPLCFKESCDGSSRMCFLLVARCPVPETCCYCVRIALLLLLLPLSVSVSFSSLSLSSLQSFRRRRGRRR